MNCIPCRNIMKTACWALVLIVLSSSEMYSQEPTRWRGPQANGIYPDGGLLKEWPQAGPELLWSFERLGEGHSSPAISGGHIYMPTMIDKMGYMFKLTMDGSLVWRVEYGPEFHRSYPGSRSTATVAGDLLYMLSGVGKLVCMNTGNGTIRWSKDLVEDLGGTMNRYGFNETVVVDGNTVYCTPGGKTQNVVALNRFSGDLIWACPGKGEKSAYCTPLMVRLSERTLLITHSESYILGIDTDRGELLWSYSWPNQRLEHQNTPLYHDGRLFCFSGYGKGAVMLRLSPDGRSVTKQWLSEPFDNRMGGAVLVDGYIYGPSHHNRSWQCLDWDTGKQMYASTALALGAVICADGRLYCCSEKSELALAKPDPSGFEIISRTTVSKGTGPQWAHPVIHGGVLYISHGSALIAYKIR